MDLTDSIQARSDQINADDLIQGPETYTVLDVVEGKAEQPIDIMLVETDRAYRPSKTMRRVIVAAWGREGSLYAGRRLTLFRDPSIRFGGQAVGGIRVSHMSHIDKRVEVMLQTTRGKRERFVVEPLADPPARDWRAEADALTDKDALADLWRSAPKSDRDYIAARGRSLSDAAELDAAPDGQLIP